MLSNPIKRPLGLCHGRVQVILSSVVPESDKRGLLLAIFLGGQMVKSPPAIREMWVWSLGWGDPLEEDMATHSRLWPGESPWTEESVGLQRVRHDWATKHRHHLSIFRRAELWPPVSGKHHWVPTPLAAQFSASTFWRLEELLGVVEMERKLCWSWEGWLDTQHTFTLLSFQAPHSSSALWDWQFFTLLLFGASLIAQLVKNLPAMQETWVWFLGWEDPLEKEMAIHSSILAWKIHGQRRLAGLITPSCPVFCDPMDCSLSSFSVRGILLARILEWVAMLSSRGFSWTRGWAHISSTAGEFFNIGPLGKPNMKTYMCIFNLMDCSSESHQICTLRNIQHTLIHIQPEADYRQQREH